MVCLSHDLVNRKLLYTIHPIWIPSIPCNLLYYHSVLLRISPHKTYFRGTQWRRSWAWHVWWAAIPCHIRTYSLAGEASRQLAVKCWADMQETRDQSRGASPGCSQTSSPWSIWLNKISHGGLWHNDRSTLWWELPKELQALAHR